MGTSQEFSLIAEIGKIEINILRRANLNSCDYWDANWLESEIKISIPDFTAIYEANLRVDDLQKFYDQLISLEKLDIKKATFSTLEQGLHLECVANSRGAILCHGKAINKHNTSLDFELETDIPSIIYWIKEIGLVLQKYPLIGECDANLEEVGSSRKYE